MNIDDSSLDHWKKSRSGAWAGRGFHYQHLFSTLILIGQWAGLFPSGCLVPEGEEDCVIETQDEDVWLQIKSKKSGSFGPAEISLIIKETEEKAAKGPRGKKRKVVVGLEQPSSVHSVEGIERIFLCKHKGVVVCPEPNKDIISLIVEQLDIAEILAEGIASDIYKLVASCAAENASLDYKNRRRISTTEIERRIFERLEAEDPTAINEAFVSRALEPVDFVTSTQEEGFYQGVKVAPKHVASGLVFSRADEIVEILKSLKRYRQVLISGPSGAGKSALMWLAAFEKTDHYRWFQIMPRASVQDTDSIVRFLRARRPSPSSPIAFAFDDIDSSNSLLWEVLAKEFQGVPNVYLLGSIRQEDVNLIGNQSDVGIIHSKLSDQVAEGLWDKLKDQGLTQWSHWREPFEMSDGLMLEYVHILTQGKRLDDVISDQVRLREDEGREVELSIVRYTSALASLGGEVDVKKLCSVLGIKRQEASKALKRLVNEHIVQENRPGVLGGLHRLRSLALRGASHDEMVNSVAETEQHGLIACTPGTMPLVIKHILADMSDENKADTLQRLADLLDLNDDLEVWVSVLTGLGLGNLEKAVDDFVKILQKHKVQVAQWSICSMFTAAGNEFPKIDGFEHMECLYEAVSEFHRRPNYDLRVECLDLLDEATSPPKCASIDAANRLLSCIVAMPGSEAIDGDITPSFEGVGECDIQKVASLLSTLYETSPKAAAICVDTLGGEDALLSWFKNQTPWAAEPIIEETGEHGRTVRANLYLCSNNEDFDYHAQTVKFCETLIALSPRSETAACQVVDVNGDHLEIIDGNKNMSRQNLLCSARVAWNVAFRQVLLSKIKDNSLTSYTEKMVKLVRRTEKALKIRSESWLNTKPLKNADELAKEVNEIIEEVNDLAYISMSAPIASVDQPSEAGVDDTIGALLTGILGNLLGRLPNFSPGEEMDYGVAAFAADLVEQAEDHENSDIWRVVEDPPHKELGLIKRRLIELSYILYELRYDHSTTSIVSLLKAGKKGGSGKRIHAASIKAKFQAEQRLQKTLRNLEKSLKNSGWQSKCYTKPTGKGDSAFWPSVDIAVLIEISDFERDMEYIEQGLMACKELLSHKWIYRVVPVMSGIILAEFAMGLSFDGTNVMPDLSFADEWSSYIKKPFLKAPNSIAYDKAFSACNTISAIINARDTENLLPEEDKALAKALDEFEMNFKVISDYYYETDIDHFGLAVEKLGEGWAQVVQEHEDLIKGKIVDSPVCMSNYNALRGIESDEINQLAVMRMFLRQEELEYQSQIKGGQLYDD